MSLGPELIEAVSSEIAASFCRSRLRKAESGDEWMALSFSGDRIIFFSWDAESYGPCLAAPDEIRAMSELAARRPPLLGAVKSHAVGAELTGAAALGRDRVLEVTFVREVGAGFCQTKKLVFEASGRYSNLALLDERGVVIESAKHIHPETNRYRSIIPGHPYAPPPPIAGVPIEDFTGGPEGLDGVSGVGKPLLAAIKEMCRVTGEHDAGGILRRMSSEPPVYQVLGKYVTLFPELLAGARRIDAVSALAAARECVILPLLARHTARARKAAASRIERLAAANAKKIAEAEAARDGTAAESFMRDGQAILANIQRIPPRASWADLPEWGPEGETTRRVELDPERDAQGNAERCFAKYRKKRASIERSTAILPKLHSERDIIREQEALLACHSDALTIKSMMGELSRDEAVTKGKKQKERPKPPHRRVEFPEENAVMLIGLSAAGNHYVTFRMADGDDIWLHAQGTPGAHVILRFTSKPDPGTYNRMIGIAASAAAFYSKAKESVRVRVDYALRKHVRAIPGAGPAQVTYKEFSSINADASAWRHQGTADYY
ncbi:MAG: NFACT family protein [Synergistaceae bacterium]|nr:NFACT family protein [Synergistaceae bacterium]